MRRTTLGRRWRTWLMRVRLRIAKLRAKVARSLEPDRRRSTLGTVAVAGLRTALILTAPFIVLVRGAVWLYHRGLPTWLALLWAGVATLALLTLYGSFVSRRLTGKARAGFVAKWIAAPLVVGYMGVALFHLSQVNAKSDAIRSVYTATHPLLRVALTTLILVDRDAVVTDLARTPADYARMGLADNPRSRHYRQPDGWVHAVDLRTTGAVRDFLVEWYFRAMGFETLRHVGTADHLHVSLASQ